MERLIEFLLHNIYFVIVVIGLIYGMFFRKSPEERKGQNRMPDFSGGGMRKERPQAPPARPARPARPGEPPEHRRPPVRETGARPVREEPRYGLPSRPNEPATPERRRPAPAAAPAHAEEQPTPWDEAFPGESPAQAAGAAAAAQASAPAARPATAHPGTAAATMSSLPESPIYAAPAGDLHPTREDLARAVVWSEILGPPRSRKPYRR